MKHLFDLTLAAVLLVLAAIPMAVIALIVKFQDGSPVLFRQIRIGRGMRPFRLVKFRTMRSAGSGDASVTVGADPRITGLGCWLRKYRLDELPQLLNILVGQMSFVGPRPEIPEFVDADNLIQHVVCQVRPGLVDPASIYWLGEAQLLGQVENWREYYRTVILPDKLARSLDYLNNRSMQSDVKLLWRASRLVVQQRKKRTVG